VRSCRDTDAGTPCTVLVIPYLQKDVEKLKKMQKMSQEKYSNAGKKNSAQCKT